MDYKSKDCFLPSRERDSFVPAGRLDAPYTISAKAWCMSYGAVYAYTPKYLGGDEHWFRARVYENGDVEIFNKMDPAVPIAESVIPADITPTIRLDMADLYGLVNRFPPFRAPDFPPGIYDMAMTFEMDEPEFRDTYGITKRQDPTSYDPTKGMFSPCSRNLGAEMIDGKLEREAELWKAIIRVNITDPSFFVMKVSQGGRDSGRDSDYVPESIGDAIFEGFFGASEVGTPLDCGFEIHDWADGPLTNEANARIEECNLLPA